MGSAAIVVLLVATGEIGDPSTGALTQTAEAALEGRAIVIVREADRAHLTDSEAVKLGGALHADAVVVVGWSQPDRRRAFVHLYDARAPRWIDRSLAFSPDDPSAERGRMIGFELAAMVPGHAEPGSSPAPGIAGSATSAEAAPANGAAPTGETPSPRPPEPSSSSSSSTHRAALDLVALATSGIAGDAGGVGGELGARIYLTGALGVRAAGGVRVGSIPSARADTSVVRLAAGFTSRVAELPGALPFAVGARMDLVALRHGASSIDNASSGAHWVPGADALVELEWTVARPMSVVAAAGVEVAFGTTRVLLDGAEIATIPPFRGTGEVGLRLTF